MEDLANKSSYSIVDVTMDEPNDSILQPNASQSFIDNRNNISAQIENYLSQIQEAGSYLLNLLKEDVVPRREKRIVHVPPEFDENDTRWTLRHRQPGPGLKELIENSEVHVEVDKLNRYTGMATSSEYLTKVLMTIIFTDEALSYCNMFAQKKNKLDNNAVNVLFEFVKGFASRKGLPAVDLVTFNDWVRSKLRSMKIQLLP
ncbi:hypothetical protein O3G_MSEX015016 [Manduca sexta]|uniref:Uncharacterized protein n=1 Tax=Manduca sexta TaxID=7130 RepID=A0A921ZY03_MANSE|nr:hypothetical protein O3G_MSEX015016 [Manduca sexta]